MAKVSGLSGFSRAYISGADARSKQADSNADALVHALKNGQAVDKYLPNWMISEIKAKLGAGVSDSKIREKVQDYESIWMAINKRFIERLFGDILKNYGG